MPILDADKAQNIAVIKRSKGAGQAGIGNALFFEENGRLRCGSTQGGVGNNWPHHKALN